MWNPISLLLNVSGSLSEMSLYITLSDRIVDHVKRAIRHISINIYETLFEALQPNLSFGTSIEL